MSLETSDQIYTAREAARILGIAPKTLIKYAKLRHLSYIKYPGRRASYHFRRSALDYFVGVNTTPATKAPLPIRRAA